MQFMLYFLFWNAKNMPMICLEVIQHLIISECPFPNSYCPYPNRKNNAFNQVFPPDVFKYIIGNNRNDFDWNSLHSHQSKEQTTNKKFNVGNRGTTD